MAKSAAHRSPPKDADKRVIRNRFFPLEEKSITYAYIVAGIILFFGILWVAFVGDDISPAFLVEVFSGVGGVLFGTGVQRYLHSLSAKDEQENKDKILVADLYEYLHGENGKKKAEYVLAPHLKKYHEWENTSGRHSPGSTAKLLEKSANSALDRWNESFELLASCPEFHSAWDLFLVLRKDIQDTVQGSSDLVSSLFSYDEEKADGGIRRTGSDIDESDRPYLRTALRNLESGLRRRDESFVEIPSLQTMLEEDELHLKVSRRLADFWLLFHIVSTDIRMAYLRLLALWEICEKENTECGVNSDDVRLVNRTILGALERIRNCITILRNRGDLQEIPEQATKSPQDSGYEETEVAKTPGLEAPGASQKDQVGNTMISWEGRKDLIREAKMLEGGDTLNEGDEMEKMYRKILPANFGVMIRDIDTACEALEKIKGVKEED